MSVLVSSLKKSYVGKNTARSVFYSVASKVHIVYLYTCVPKFAKIYTYSQLFLKAQNWCDPQKNLPVRVLVYFVPVNYF